MKVKLMAATFMTLILIGCTKEYDCSDAQVLTAFIGFQSSEIDTIILKKFRQNDNYQHLVDTFNILYGYTGQYNNTNDTTSVFVNDGKNGIKAGYDWQIFIPANNRSIFITEIVSEKRTGKCGYGVFSMDKFGCTCTNQVFSAKNDNQVIRFVNSDTVRNFIYIRY